MPKAIWIFLFLAEMDFVSLDPLQSYAASHHLIVSSFIRDLVLDQLEEHGELEEARILKALELSYKEVYRIKKSTIWRKCYKNG